MSEPADIGEHVAPQRVAPQSLGRISWLPPALAAGAVLALLTGAVDLGIALSARWTGSAGISSTVIPARSDLQAPLATNASRAGTPAAGATSAASPAPASAGAAVGRAAPVIIGGPCAAAPTVQFQGRGLATTGVAPVTPASPANINLYVSMQERGSVTATVITNAQAKVRAVVSAPQQVGVPGSAIQQTSFSSFGDLQGRQFTAYASIQAHVIRNDQLTQATRAVLGIGGVSGYSTSSSLAVQPTEAEVQAAVSDTAGQARDMAGATARAAGVTLGNVQSVATQPLAVCYGRTGPPCG